MPSATHSLPLAALLSLAAAPAAQAEPPPGPAAEASGPAATAASPGPAAPAPAVGITPTMGMNVPTSQLGLFVVGGLELDVFLPVADHRLVLALGGTITRPSHDGKGTDPRTGDYTFTVRETELKVGLDVVWRFFTEERALVPYAGLGPILHMLRSTETNSLGPGQNTGQSTKPGFELVGGADYKVGPGRLLAEARLVYSTLDHQISGDTNAGNVIVSVGYRLLF